MQLCYACAQAQLESLFRATGGPQRSDLRSAETASPCNRLNAIAAVTVVNLAVITRPIAIRRHLPCRSFGLLAGWPVPDAGRAIRPCVSHQSGEPPCALIRQVRSPSQAKSQNIAAIGTQLNTLPVAVKCAKRR